MFELKLVCILKNGSSNIISWREHYKHNHFWKKQLVCLKLALEIYKMESLDDDHIGDGGGKITILKA